MAPLRLPASPSGRDVTFRRGKDGAPGTLEWHVPRYRLPELGNVVETGVEATGEKWVALDRPPVAGEGLDALVGWARRKYPTVTWSVDGLAPEALKPALDQFDLLASGWPQVHSFVKSVTTKRLRAIAQATADGELRLDDMYWSRPDLFERQCAAETDAGDILPGMASYQGYLTHEWAHLAYWQAADADAGGDVETLRSILQWQADHETATDVARLAVNNSESWAFCVQAAYHAIGDVPEAVESMRALLRRLGKVV